MKLSTQRPFSLYKREILQLLVAIIFSFSIISGGYLYVDDIEKQKADALKQQGAINAEIDHLVENEAIVNMVGARFSQLKANGFYALEDRLAWTEVLKRVSEQLKLPNFKYSISPQKSHSNIGSGFQPNLGLSESLMTIEGDLLHEGDFITITQQLDIFSPGVFVVRECTLEQGGGIVTTQIKKNLTLKCLLAWYSIQPPSNGEREP